MSVRADKTRDVRILITQLSKTLTDQARSAIDEAGLTKTQAALLRDLDEPRTQRELADSLPSEPSNVTFVVDKLEARGLVERRAHPTDRRANVVHLTPEGEQVREQMIDTFESSTPLGSLSDEQLEQLRHLLQLAMDAH